MIKQLLYWWLVVDAALLAVLGVLAFVRVRREVDNAPGITTFAELARRVTER